MSKAVIFDIDGTLVDSVDVHARAWQETFEHFGKKVEFKDIREQIGKGGDQLMPVFLSEEEIEQKSKEIEDYREELFKTQYLSQVKAFPGVRELFEHLRRDGFEIALASSAKAEDLEAYKRISKITDLLETETSSDDAEQSKPEPDIFLAALKRLGKIDRHKVVVVGDTPYDAEAAGKAGLRTLGFLCGGFAEEQLRNAGCIEIYRDAVDLLHQFDNSLLAKLQ
jgi:HAD superfamily hydrolase (TIGR01509 family)